MEFAKDQYARGMGLYEAAVEAARLQFRPILMTSLAFILGVVPLAGHRRRPASTRWAWACWAACLPPPFAVMFVPTFFVVVLGLFKTKPACWRELKAFEAGRQEAAEASGAQLPLNPMVWEGR